MTGGKQATATATATTTADSSAALRNDKRVRGSQDGERTTSKGKSMILEL
jgi:hypothetical protein